MSKDAIKFGFRINFNNSAVKCPKLFSFYSNFKAASKIPLFSTPSSKDRFQRPFIKPHSDNKENSRPFAQQPINKKQAVFIDPSRKLSLTSQDSLLSPGHPSSTQKPISFKSPQRPNNTSYYNIKASGIINPTSMNKVPNSPDLSKERTDRNNNLLERVKTFSNDLVQSTKSFINFKINRFSHREKCACEAGLNPRQTCENALGWLFKRYTKKDLAYLQTVYENLQKNPLVDETIRTQINRDLLRTFPNCEFFKEGHEGIRVLEKVLVTFASYDPQIGYVQGMNYIAGFFVYHAEEYIAFWLLASLFELFELRDVYLPSNILFYYLIKTTSR